MSSSFRRKLLGPGLVSLLVGAAIVAVSYLRGSAEGFLLLGVGGLLMGVAELVGWQYVPIVTVSPWGIIYRRSVFSRRREFPREQVVSWFDTSVEVQITVRGGETITVALSELHRGDGERLTVALRECGYASSAGYVQPS